jgi:small membrane protein
MLVIQILLIVFFMFALVKVASRWRAGYLSTGGFIGWSLFWVASAIVVLSPDSTFYLAKLVGVGRGADLVVYAALVIIFFIIFKLMIKIEMLNKDITKLTRKIALAEKNNPTPYLSPNRGGTEGGVNNSV